jgi:UDP-N-acetylmuramoyl-tripeptide--D-alanyl-D-alanine ligase
MDYRILDSFWPILLYAVCETAGMVLAARVLLHFFQLESYQFRGYFKTAARQWHRACWPGVALTIGFLFPFFVLAFAFAAITPLTIVILAVIQLSLGFILYRKAAKTPQKKKFAMIARMKRLYAALAVVCTAAVWLNFWAVSLPAQTIRYDGYPEPLSGVVGCIRPSLFLPLLVALAGLLALPIERLIFHLYFRDAEKKLLENPRLIRIGITGSYGKTSTKFILRKYWGRNITCWRPPLPSTPPWA